MKTETLKHATRQFDYKSDSFDTLLSNIKEYTTKQGYHLVLLAGDSEEKRKEAFDQILDQTERDVKHVDANTLFSANENATYKRLDELFEMFDAENSIMFVTNGANLCGAFTGYSLSKVKYATPQEKYFLKKIKAHNAFVVIEFETIDGVDITLNRASHAIVTFPVPNSGLKGLMARLKQIHLNGFDLNSKRPVPPQNTMANF